MASTGLKVKIWAEGAKEAAEAVLRAAPKMVVDEFVLLCEESLDRKGMDSISLVVRQLQEKRTDLV